MFFIEQNVVTEIELNICDRHLAKHVDFYIFIMELLHQISDINSLDYVFKADNGLEQSLQKYVPLFENTSLVITFERKFNNFLVKNKSIHTRYLHDLRIELVCKIYLSLRRLKTKTESCVNSDNFLFLFSCKVNPWDRMRCLSI